MLRSPDKLHVAIKISNEKSACSKRSRLFPAGGQLGSNPHAWLTHISNDAGSVKLFMSALLRSLQRVSLCVVCFGPVDDRGSLVIFRSVSVRPTHLFDPSFRP